MGSSGPNRPNRGPRALGFDETDRSGDKTLAVKVPVLGCFSKPCWLQSIRVGIDETNSVSGLAKVGLYLSDA